MFSFAKFLKGLTILNDADQTKQLSVTVSSSATTATATTLVAQQTASQTLTLPDITDTLSTPTLPESPTNKTFDSSSTMTGVKIASFTPDGSNTLTAPTITDTLVARSTTDTLTNKTMDGGSNTFTNLPASALTGVATVPHGGTGNSSFTTNQVLLAGTTSTGNLQQVPGGTSGFVLTSNGATAAPTWQVGAATGTSTPTANTVSKWDGNVNMSANSFIEGYATTVTAAGTTSLNVASPHIQYFTGSTTQTVLMPNATTLVLGQQYLIVNKSTGAVLIQSSAGGGGTSIVSLVANSEATLTVVNTGADNPGSWDWSQVNAGNLNPPITTLTSPTIQTFGVGSGTYTTPAGVKYLKVLMVGGGGGGSGSGTASLGNGGNGTATTFGTSVLSADFGRGAAAGSGGGGSVGASFIHSAASAFGISIAGQFGMDVDIQINSTGGMGGSSAYFGGGGTSGTDIIGRAATANTGSGGGGGGSGSTASSTPGAGGGSGVFIEAIIRTPLSSYSYTVGTGGSGGTAGTSGHAGGAGAAGFIIVWEYYQ